MFSSRVGKKTESEKAGKELKERQKERKELKERRKERTKGFEREKERTERNGVKRKMRFLNFCFGIEMSK